MEQFKKPEMKIVQRILGMLVISAFLFFLWGEVFWPPENTADGGTYGIFSADWMQVQLDFATGGDACLSMTKEKKYDLILNDHMMPEPDGVQTLHRIREDRDNVNQNTTIIVLTANAIEGMREQYLAEGFEDFLSKPLNVEKLEKMLAKYLV